MDWAEHPGFAVTNRIISDFSRSNRAFFWEPFPNRLGDIITTFVVYGYERNGGNPYSNETGWVVFQFAVASFFALPSAIIGAILSNRPCMPWTWNLTRSSAVSDVSNACI